MSWEDRRATMVRSADSEVNTEHADMVRLLMREDEARQAYKIEVGSATLDTIQRRVYDFGSGLENGDEEEDRAEAERLAEQERRQQIEAEIRRREEREKKRIEDEKRR